MGRQDLVGGAAVGGSGLLEAPGSGGAGAGGPPRRSRTSGCWWPKVGSISGTGADARFRASSGPSQRTPPEALTLPDAGVSSPAARRNRRLLPEPFSPTMPTTVPSGATTSKLSSGALVTLRNARDIRSEEQTSEL